MKPNHSTSDPTNKGSFVSKLSPHDSSLEGMFAKVTASFAVFLGGVTLSDVFTLASVVYVLLNIFVLVRDKIILPWRAQKLETRRQQQKDAELDVDI